MSCEKCKETCCVVSSSFRLKDGTRVFTDLRFDVENNQFDMEFGTLDEEGYAMEADWSNSTDIKFCPYCGAELPEIE